MKWNQTKYGTLVLGAFAATSLLLSACGGGGGGGGGDTTVQYTGKTDPATVNSTSAPKLSGTAISTASTDTSVPTFKLGASGSGSAPVAQLKKIADMAKKMAANATASGTLTGAQTSQSQTITGCSGSATGTISYDDTAVDYYGSNIIYSMSITYANFVDIIDPNTNPQTCDTVTFNGTVAILVGYDSNYILNSLTISFTNLSMTEGGNTAAYNGSYGLTWDNTTGTSYFSMNVDFQDVDGLVYRVQNYRVDFDDLGRITSISGRLYDPLYGYVDIATTTPFSYLGTCTNGAPDTGVMTLTGDGTITVDVGITGDCATYQVSWVASDSSTGSTVVYW